MALGVSIVREIIGCLSSLFRRANNSRKSLEPKPSESEYADLIRQALTNASASIGTRLTTCLRNVDDKTRKLFVGISTDQEGEGYFSIWMYADGPDFVMRNKSLGETRELFCVRNTPEGIKPNLPLFDPFDAPFPIKPTILETAKDWFLNFWVSSELQISIPIAITIDEGFGIEETIELP